MQAADALIVNQADLDEFCRKLRDADWFCVDTEFVREDTYYPVLCLLQVGTPDMFALVDPLKSLDLTELLEILYDDSKRMYMHSASQDLEIFYELTGKVPTNLWDTQIAASMIGLGDQLGYAGLVNAFLNQTVSKGHQRVDWSRRPLSDGSLEYAADDVRLLAKIVPKLHQRLDELGRSAWFQEEMNANLAAYNFNPDPEDAWLKVKRVRQLSAKAQASVKAIATWRENEARSANRPRGWILKDDTLHAIAQRGPRNIRQLDELRGTTPKFVQRHGNTILDLITNAPEVEALKAPKAPSEKVQVMVEMMQMLMRIAAANHNISATRLASKDELLRLAKGERELQVLSGWRHELLGEDLLALLEGKLSFGMCDGHPELFRQ